MHKRSRDHLCCDEFMARVVERVGPIRLKARRLAPYQSIVQSIVYQQLSGKAAGTILGRFCALYPGQEFPSPESVAATDFERLRSVGLSRPKATYIQGVAQKAMEGFIPTLAECDRMEDEQLIERLVQLKGVGRWTVEMLLIFNLGREDVLPIHDLGVQRGFQFAYGKRRLPKPEQLGKHGVRWKPYRTAAALYLWRAADTFKPEPR